MAMKLSLLLLLSFLCLRSLAEYSGSVIFFDAPHQRFVRSNSLKNEGEAKELSADEVAAAVSVLLGSSPDLLSVESSFKLNQVLFPILFDKPQAVFLLEVTGITDFVLFSAISNSKVGSRYSSALVPSTTKTRLQYDVNDVSVVPLEETLTVECDAACLHRELVNLGGEYVGNPELVDGELNFPLPSGSSLNLHLTKKSDREYAESLVSLVRNIQKILGDREIFAESRMGHADLLVGRFTGIEALKEEYGSGDIVHQGTELLQATITKLFESLQKTYEGKIVGVVLSDPSVNSGPMVELSARESRWLQEEAILTTKTAEVMLVRRTLAWITGIILLVSTLLGVCCLMNMPLTRDTLLYSNVKLD